MRCPSLRPNLVRLEDRATPALLATSSIAATATSAFSPAARSVPLTATVVSPGGPVAEGTETFTVLDGAKPIGSPVTVPVVSGFVGLAKCDYTLPAGTPAGAYTIRATYNGTARFAPSSDASAKLTNMDTSATTVLTSNSMGLTTAGAAILAPTTVRTAFGMPVTAGTVTFTVLDGAKSLGSPVTVPASAAFVSYPLPSGTPAGVYAVRVAYSGTATLAASVDLSHTLTLVRSPASPAPFAPSQGPAPTWGSGPQGNFGPGFPVSPAPFQGPSWPSPTHLFDGMPQDPNDLIGPTGVGPQHAIQSGADAAYKVEFENDGTGAARFVSVSGRLDPNFDFSTFRFGSLDFGTAHIEAPAGAAHFQTTVPYRNVDGSPLDVLVALDFDARTGEFRAQITALDPLTGRPLGEHRGGMLPPNTASHAGEGYLAFTVQPKATLAPGTLISQKAAVVFDANAPVETPTVTNTIAAPPSGGAAPAAALPVTAAKAVGAGKPGAVFLAVEPLGALTGGVPVAASSGTNRAAPGGPVSGPTPGGISRVSNIPEALNFGAAAGSHARSETWADRSIAGDDFAQLVLSTGFRALGSS